MRRATRRQPGNHSAVTSRTPSPNAAIIIFGAAVRPDGQASATLRRRVEAAARFGAQLQTPVFIPTGGIGRHGPAEAEVMAALLADLGVDPARIMPETTATDTLSSVRAVRRIVRALPPGLTVYAATSAYHLPRCLLVLRLAGVPAMACPPPPEPAAARWLLRWYWRLREVPAIPYDAALVVALRVLRRL